MYQKEKNLGYLGLVYIGVNKINQKVYVGQTIQKSRKRWCDEKHSFCNPYLRHALQKYGIDGFLWMKVYCKNLEEMDFFEKQFITIFDSLYPNGYNFKTGGNKNHHQHEITKQKIGDSKRGKKRPKEIGERLSKIMKGRFSGNKNPMYGRSLYSVWLEKYGKSIADEKMKAYKEKSSKIRMGKKNPFFGKKHTKETRKRMRENHKGTTGKHWHCSRNNPPCLPIQ